MKLVSIVLFFTASASILAQSAVPIKKVETPRTSTCKEANFPITCMAATIYASPRDPKEMVDMAKQAGLEASFSKSEDGHAIRYLFRNPKSGQRAIVIKKL